MYGNYRDKFFFKLKKYVYQFAEIVEFLLEILLTVSATFRNEGFARFS